MYINKEMTNAEIFAIAIALRDTFENDNIQMPAKASFCLAKNKNTFTDLAQEVEKVRNSVFEKYGTLNEEQTGYNFTPDVIDVANKELEDLFNVAQEVKIYLLDLDDLKDVKLTTQQMSVLMVMINDNE